jgi:predicted dehydrogenase
MNGTARRESPPAPRLTRAPVPVVLVGVYGHGWWHLENLRRLTQAGIVRLAGVCDVRPVEPERLRGLGRPEQSEDLGQLIERTGAKITILVTPIQTHAELAVQALEAGSHLLLEKPPAATFAGFQRISAVAARTGLGCQVGFQSLGSAAIPAIRQLIADGVVGRVKGIGVAGAWERDAAYFTRSAWAGRRRVGGVEVVDGALTNPFAHAVATALAVAGSGAADEVTGVDVELYHANPIEADDTSCLRIRLADGPPITVAVSLTASRRHEPYVIVHGTEGRITLTYTLDRVRVERVCREVTTVAHPRGDLLENLVAHVRDGDPLLVPLARTGAFMRVLETIRLAPDPLPIPDEHQEIDRDERGAAVRRVLPGIANLTARSAEHLALYSELDVPWAAPRAVLRVRDRAVAEYNWRPDLATTLSPRPYLHPVRTLGGVTVTELNPADHVHHLGVSVAIADVGGRNFWGGRTYVRDVGPTWLDDHGVQRHLTFVRRDDRGFTETLRWAGPDGVEILDEERTVTAAPLAGCWALDFRFTLTNLTGSRLLVQSSATKGRAGAGYGGFFWRAPGSSTGREAFIPDGGEPHGSRAPWLAMSGSAPEGDWTLVFVQDADPWFVRVEEYPGAGPALAWDQPLVVERTLTRRVVTVVADGRLSRAQAEALATQTSGGQPKRKAEDHG